ncbi:hypothetical protein [Frondihabitans sucicola]|uniref:hypothetical protein n=1 Tax=Frondihabitans sucicola TaxID=1268041 RepID=UPI0025747E5D|nr:hypothetical protein [Frondihabitans sucicola]
MSESTGGRADDAAGRQVSRRRPGLLWLLIVLLTGEFLLMVVVSIALIAQVFTAHADSLAAGLAILVLALVATVWLGFIVVAAWNGKAWMRGASIVWQVLMFAVGIGCFQGLTATPAVGWALVVPAVLIVVLLVSPPVVTATTNRD